MIYLLYTNDDKIEGRGHRVLLGVSTDLKKLKSLSDSIPISMGGKCPECEIHAFQDALCISPAQVAKLENHKPKKVIHRFSQSNQWFDSYTDYEDYLRKIRHYNN